MADEEIKRIAKELNKGKSSGKTIKELEELCIELEIRIRKTKDILREISKFINKEINKL